MTDAPFRWSVRRDFTSGSTTVVAADDGRPGQGLVALLDDANLDAPLTLVVDLDGVPEKILMSAASLLATWAAGRTAGPELRLSVDPGTPAGRLLPALLGQHAMFATDADAPPRRPARVHLYLTNDRESPAAGRRLVADCCHAWGFEAIADQALVVVSELISNAVQHAGTDLDLTVADVDGVLRLSVRDRTTRPPHPAPADDGGLAERGRGLAIVRALSTGWGFLTFADGKTVWATLGRRDG